MRLTTQRSVRIALAFAFMAIAVSSARADSDGDAYREHPERAMTVGLEAGGGPQGAAFSLFSLGYTTVLTRALNFDLQLRGGAFWPSGDDEVRAAVGLRSRLGVGWNNVRSRMRVRVGVGAYLVPQLRRQDGVTLFIAPSVGVGYRSALGSGDSTVVDVGVFLESWISTSGSGGGVIFGFESQIGAGWTRPSAIVDDETPRSESLFADMLDGDMELSDPCVHMVTGQQRNPVWTSIAARCNANAPLRAHACRAVVVQHAWLDSESNFASSAAGVHSGPLRLRGGMTGKVAEGASEDFRAAAMVCNSTNDNAAPVFEVLGRPGMRVTVRWVDVSMPADVQSPARCSGPIVDACCVQDFSRAPDTAVTAARLDVPLPLRSVRVFSPRFAGSRVDGVAASRFGWHRGVEVAVDVTSRRVELTPGTAQAPVMVCPGSVGPAPRITSFGPPPGEEVVGNTVLRVVAVGQDLTYSWSRDGSPIEEANSPTLTVPVATPIGTTFTVEVYGADGQSVASEPVSVSVRGARPRFTEVVSTPPGGRVAVGEPLTLSAAVLGENLTFQWYRNNRVVRGATARELVIAATRTRDAGVYHLKACNAAGCEESRTLGVLVVPAAATPAGGGGSPP